MKSSAMENPRARGTYGGPPGRAKSSSRYLSSSSRSLVSGNRQQSRRRIHTKEITRFDSFRGGDPLPTSAGYPLLEEVGRLKSFRRSSLEEVGRLKSFRQASLRKLGSIRNLESLRQGSFRQLDATAFTEIVNTSCDGSIVLEAEDGQQSKSNGSRSTSTFSTSFAESCHGPISTIEFVPGQPDGTVVEHVEIEIAPGVYKRLRGSEETQRAWEQDKCVEAMCFVCDTLLAVAPACDCVICPVCRSISPVFTDDASTFTSDSHESWWLTVDDNDAVGLGIAIPEY